MAFKHEPEVDTAALTEPTSRGLVADLSQAQSLVTYALSLCSPGMTARAGGVEPEATFDGSEWDWPADGQ